MKRSILVTLCAILLLSCKKDNTNEPDAFRIFTRSPVNIGGTGTTYMLKGTVVTEGSLEVAECGFLYTQNGSSNNNLPDYNSTATIRFSVFGGGKLPSKNFEKQVLLVSAQYYYIAAYVKVHNKKTEQDEIITGSYVQLNTP